LKSSPPRLGFLVSAFVHVTLIMILVDRSLAPRVLVPETVPAAPLRGPAVFLPPPEVLRQLWPSPVAPPPVRPAPAPAPVSRDRISVGAPSAERAKGPMVLRREDDLTATPRGTPRGDRTERAAAPAVPTPPPPTAAPPPADLLADGRDTRPGALRLPPGLGRSEPSGTQPPAGPPSLARTLRDLDRRLSQAGPSGTVTGTGQQMGPLFFDPEGADFTVWINHFKNEVYRNWLLPQAVLLGVRGHVDLEFTVERDGRVTNLRLLKSAGNPALDKSAANAIVASRFMPLPSDFASARVTMQVSFYYGDGPQGS
jgi:periplasmic protein TonB